MADALYSALSVQIISDDAMLSAFIDYGEQFPVMAAYLMRNLFYDRGEAIDEVRIIISIVESNYLSLLKELAKFEPDWIGESVVMRTAIEIQNWEIVEYLIDIGATVPTRSDLPIGYVPFSKKGLDLLKSIGIEVEVTEV